MYLVKLVHVDAPSMRKRRNYYSWRKGLIASTLFLTVFYSLLFSLLLSSFRTVPVKLGIKPTTIGHHTKSIMNVEKCNFRPRIDGSNVVMICKAVHCCMLRLIFCSVEELVFLKWYERKSDFEVVFLLPVKYDYNWKFHTPLTTSFF